MPPTSQFKVRVFSILPVLLIIQILITPVQSPPACASFNTYALYDAVNGNYYNMVDSCVSCPLGSYRNYLYDMVDDWNPSGLVSVYDCLNCPNNCTACDDISTCTSCLSGFGVNATGACTDCSITYGSGCQTCNSVQCLACGVGRVANYSATTSSCITCSAMIGCTSCTDGPVCLGCSSGYYRNISLPYKACSLCSVITNCQNCYGFTTTSFCTSCLTGFYLNYTDPNYACVPCSAVANCQSCLNGPKCTLCNIDWYLDFGNDNKTCVQCSFIPNCQSCVDGPVCTSCMTNYFLDFNSLNHSCIGCTLFKCLTCVDGPKCTSCQPGYFVDIMSGQCIQCIFPCAECTTDGTTCSKCPSSQLYYLNTMASTCQLCYNSLTNCLTCNQQGTLCYQCNSTSYYIDSTSQCATCLSPCLTCLSSSQCLSCVDTTYALVQSTNSCLLCSSLMPRCTNCLQSNVCTTCETATGTYFLTYPPSACVTCNESRPNCISCSTLAGIGPVCDTCKDKFFLTNYSCSPCPAICALCTSFSVCSSCINATYTLSNQMCMPCSQVIVNCLQCSSSTTCTLCTNRTIADASGSNFRKQILDCVNCTFLQYPDQPPQLCQPCVSPCQSCLNQNDCLTCLPFYEYVPSTKRCRDICGDSVVMTDQCDNNFAVPNDGCSDTCKQEDNYTCVLHQETVSGQTVNKSICSYNLKVNLTLLHIKKEPFKNTLTWTYSVIPYLYGLPGTTARDFNQDELKKTFLLYDIVYGPSTASTMKKVHASVSGLSIESIAVNSAQSQISLTFTHERDIKNSDIELFINFTYLRSELSIPNFVTTPDSKKVILTSSYRSDSMIGHFYTDEQYSMASTINKLALTVAWLSFLAFLIGIFTKELVGLEMAMLCQFVYLSLFYYQGILQLPLFSLKSLLYSTGLNIPWSEAGTNYALINNDPPQSLILDFDARTFSHNFNLMAMLYVLPLLCVSPFILMKAKCVRKLSMIELGHKWVDLLLGEVMLYIVLFNLQYFLLNVVVFYQDGRNTKEYLSSMIVSFGGLCTLLSLIGLIFKPQIYGNFRTVFKYDTDLLSQAVEQKQKYIDYEAKIARKFEGQSRFQGLKKLSDKFSILINQNYFWRNHKSVHALITYNHYSILGVYFILSTLALALLQHSELIILCLSGVILVELVIMRPYGRVSEKIRAIYFFIVYSTVSLIRYMVNTKSPGQQNLLPSVGILMLLCVALIWTYVTLVRYFINYAREQFSDRKGLVSKVFKIEIDNIDKDAIAEQEEKLLRKLMKKYQVVELQYNVNKVRDQLLAGYDSLGQNQPLVNGQIAKMSLEGQIKKSSILESEAIRKLQQDNNFKDLKKQLMKQKKRSKKEQMSKKVTGQKMLKLLKLDNFIKYQQEFLMPQEEKKRFKKEQQKKKNEEQIGEDQQKENEDEQFEQKPETKVATQLQQQQADSGSNLTDKDDYQSVQPQDIEEAKQKAEEEKLMIEEQQFLRYKRAMKIITNQGLTIDHQLIARNFDRI